MGVCGRYFFGSGQGPVGGYCEHGDELLSLVKWG